uniref:Uncharacterized protein n=1 Tax=Nelumbo nucifera TaxID=4432 RepID=A0A822ZHG0_NELNU|nr:TPA_asm: hypothetical protein HUJ06_002293 [Nelumbo nucifera]
MTFIYDPIPSDDLLHQNLEPIRSGHICRQVNFLVLHIIDGRL